MDIEIDDVRRILGELLVRPPARDDDDLWENGLMDSMSVVSLVTALEERFGLEFGPEHLRKANFSTVQRIHGLMRDMQRGKAR